MTMTPEEAKAIHRMEQMTAGLRQGAEAVFKYYQALIHAGFKPKEALPLAGTFQATLWTEAMAKGGMNDDNQGGANP